MSDVDAVEWAMTGPHTLGQYAGNYTVEEAREATDILKFEVRRLRSELDRANKKWCIIKAAWEEGKTGDLAAIYLDRAEKAEAQLAAKDKEIGKQCPGCAGAIIKKNEEIAAYEKIKEAAINLADQTGWSDPLQEALASLKTLKAAKK